MRYAHAAEAWLVQDEAWQGPIAEHPRRQEIVSLNADDGCECLVAMRDIVWPGGASPASSLRMDADARRRAKHRAWAASTQ